MHVNPTTVALSCLLLVLFLAAKFGLRYAVATSIAAAFCYNYYFLPPIGTLTISDPENWLAVFAFLATAFVGSRLSEHARDDARNARHRQREVEALFALSRELLQTDNPAQLLNTSAAVVERSTGARGVLLYLLDGDRIYRSGDSHFDKEDLTTMRQLALTLPSAELQADDESHIPLRAGVRPRGLLMLHGAALSLESLEAAGGLISISIDRVHALEEVTRGEAAKESERLRTLMIDSITHELRTPLTAIKASATTLLSASELSAEDTHDLLQVIDEESDRLNHLVSQAVEMAQLDTQEVHMTFHSVDIATLAQETIAICALALEKHTVQSTFPPSLPSVSCDPVYLQKVLANLLENAAKYSADGSPIFLSAERNAVGVAISVADRGVGIDPEEQSLIFDRFYRAAPRNGRVSGTGMGLAISRAIVDAHHGSITVTSQPGHGCVFTVSLPIVQ